jgi:hypothetical protein
MQVEVVDFIEALEVTYLQFLQYLINKSFHILKKCENTFVPLSIIKMTNESLEKIILPKSIVFLVDLVKNKIIKSF